jgi:hypothetical protein
LARARKPGVYVTSASPASAPRLSGQIPRFDIASLDKTKEFASRFRPFALPGFLQRLPRIETAKIYQLECAFDFISLLPGKPGATKSDRIQPKNIVALSRNNEGRNIFAEGGAALRDHQSPTRIF